MDVLLSKMDTQEKRSYSTNAVEIEEEGDHKCMTNEGLTHEGPYRMEEA